MVVVVEVLLGWLGGSEVDELFAPGGGERPEGLLFGSGGICGGGLDGWVDGEFERAEVMLLVTLPPPPTWLEDLLRREEPTRPFKRLLRLREDMRRMRGERGRGGRGEVKGVSSKFGAGQQCLQAW